jgi:aspartate dehydrogenase
MASTSTTEVPPSSSPLAPRRKRRVGIVGCGSLGVYLLRAIARDPAASSSLEVAFAWNRSPDKVSSLVAEGLVPPSAVCADLADAASFGADLIVEVCHPAVSAEWGASFLRFADFYCGSPTALADARVEAALRAGAGAGKGEGEGAAAAATASRGGGGGHGLYIPAGALWGAEDIRRMADRGSLGALTVTMGKHPRSLKLDGALGERLAAVLARLDAGEGAGEGEVVLYEGPVRALCPLAPNNVNTMAAAAIAGHTLGFDGVVARLVCDASLDAHVITVDVKGKVGGAGGGAAPPPKPFSCVTTRYNPAPPGAITGSATYASFLSSLIAAGGRGAGVHLC